MEVEHVRAHRTENDKKERFVTVGNEKADESAKAGAMSDERFKAQTRAKTVQQEREELSAALQHAASFHCLVKEWKDCEELKPQPKEKMDLRGREKGGRKASDGVVCRGQQVSMHEMWKMQLSK